MRQPAYPETHKNHSLSLFQELIPLGFSDARAKILAQDPPGPGTIGRVTGVRKNQFLVHNGHKEFLTTAMGRFYHPENRPSDFPVTGDWVRLSHDRIASVLPRENLLSRGASGQRNRQDAGPNRQQVIAANIDTVFVVCGLDRDFNIRRIERYLTLIYNCGLIPVILLTKSDLAEAATSYVEEVEAVTFGVPVHAISTVNGNGVTALDPYLKPASTIALIGSSGAGKSTLVNHLAGAAIQATKNVSATVRKGVHTTTTRDLIPLPGGALILDNPGIREIAFWETDATARTSFPEIEALAARCRFRNCTHTGEPGCMVMAAMDRGDLVPGRLESYRKHRRELEYRSCRQEKPADRLEKERWKHVTQTTRAMKQSGKILR